MTSTENTFKRFTLKKQERLKSRTTIQMLFTINNTIRVYPFKLVWLVNESDSQALIIKAGVSVSKRNHRLAVTRNLIKRRIRECYRINKHLLYQFLENQKIEVSFMIVYTSNEIIPYNEAEQKIKQLLIRLGEKVKTN